MKKITITLLMAMALTFVGCHTSDQDDVISGSNFDKELTEKELADEKVYTIVDQQPEYPGGAQAMFRFLGENIRYPREASEQKHPGKSIPNVRHRLQRQSTQGGSTERRRQQPRRGSGAGREDHAQMDAGTRGRQSRGRAVQSADQLCAGMMIHGTCLIPYIRRLVV